jgi:acetyl-CoA carboxylase/biotin carboxylase 1
VEVGQPFVEVEAMKMIMPIKATESGKITHNLSAGSVISAGDLLGSLELKDPSKVKKIVAFEGELETAGSVLEIEASESIKNILAGYNGDPEATVQLAFEAIEDAGAASELVTDSITEFLRIETTFAGKLKDDVVRDLAKANADSLGTVISVNQAHINIKLRNRLILAMLRQVETFYDRYGPSEVPESLEAAIDELSRLKGKVYG